ncbi:MAG: hypothetical protein RSD49_01440 [Hafnia sp.]
MKPSPLFLPLWNPESIRNLDRLLISTPEIPMSATLSLDPSTCQWNVSNDDQEKGAFSIKLIDILDASKAFLSYGRLGSPDNVFDSRNIIKTMQDRILGVSNTASHSSINRLAHNLMEIFPAEAVASLVLAKKGVGYFELPYITPFPIAHTEDTVPARMGIILNGPSDSAHVTWRPLGDEPEPKVLWSPNGLSKAEIDAIKGHYQAEKSYFTLATLGGARKPDGTVSEPASLLMAYAKAIPGGDRNIHSRGTNMNGIGMALRLAQHSHKKFQARLANDVLDQHFGRFVHQGWELDMSDQSMYSNPWANEEDMLDQIETLPSVVQAINAGVRPFPAMFNFFDDVAGALNMTTLTGRDKELYNKVFEPEFKAMMDAGMTTLAYAAFEQRRPPDLKQDNNFSR